MLSRTFAVLFTVLALWPLPSEGGGRRRVRVTYQAPAVQYYRPPGPYDNYAYAYSDQAGGVHVRAQAGAVTCNPEGCLYSRRYYNADVVPKTNGYDKKVDQGGSDDFVRHQQQVILVPIIIVPAYQIIIR